MAFELVPVASVDGEAVLPLAAAKAHLRVTHGAEDDLIEALRGAAVDAVQQYSMKQLVSGAWTWKGNFANPMRLGVGPVTAVTAISYLDSSGASVDLVAGDWRLGPNGTVLSGIGKTWPSAAPGEGVVTVAFTAGYANDTRPAALVSAVKLMLGHLYKHREGVIVGTISGEMPMGVTHLCDLYRPPVI